MGREEAMGNPLPTTCMVSTVLSMNLVDPSIGVVCGRKLCKY